MALPKKVNDGQVRAIITYIMVGLTALFALAKLYCAIKGYSNSVQKVADNIFTSFLGTASLLIGYFIAKN